MRAPLALALALLAAPALAQDGTGARVSPWRGEAGHRVASPPSPQPLAAGIEDPVTLIRMAESALGARRFAEASDLLERAESRLLTRAEVASEADRPAVGGAIGELAAARDALGRRDGSGATTLIGSALRRLDSGEAPAVAALPAPGATGANTPPTQAWGGGGPPAAALPAPTTTGPTTTGPTITGSTITGPAIAGMPPGPMPALPGIAPQNMPVGGSASPPIPLGPTTEPAPEATKPAPLPGSIPPASSKAPPF
jgi:hypothetical protein